MQPKKIGIRTLELDTSKLEDGSRNFFFKVNGVRIFCKGGNWVRRIPFICAPRRKATRPSCARRGGALHHVPHVGRRHV